MSKRVVVCAALLAAPALAAAGDEVGHWYVNPEAGWLITDHRRNTKDDLLYGIGFGKVLSEHWNLELNFNHATVNDRFDSGHLKLDALTLDALVVFNRAGRVAPYISFGAGGVQERPTFDFTRNRVMEEAGVGLMLKLWENSDASASFSLRPDIKARFVDEGGFARRIDYAGLLGFQFSFGPGSAPPPVASAPPPPPPPPPPTAAPAPAPQAQPAAPLDSDHDGVPDSIDRCPNTPPGVAVDPFGCPQQGSITLEGVNFETNSATLTAQSSPVLDQVAEGLRKHPRLKVEVQGHTDSTGPAQYNMSLSQRRANAVEDYLISKQVPASQLVAKGYGPTKPVASNATKQGRAKNRRVVMLVLENPGDVNVEGEGTAEIK